MKNAYNFRIQNDLIQSYFTLKKRYFISEKPEWTTWLSEFGQKRFWVSYLMARSETQIIRHVDMVSPTTTQTMTHIQLNLRKPLLTFQTGLEFPDFTLFGENTSRISAGWLKRFSKATALSKAYYKQMNSNEPHRDLGFLGLTVKAKHTNKQIKPLWLIDLWVRDVFRRKPMLQETKILVTTE